MSDSRPPESDSQLTPSFELTWSAVLLGILLSVVMGAANVYLGLRAGMTVSASIPAAVISMGILRGILNRRSVLESNLVQTAASAGESLAAGIIFTMPALLLTGVWEEFDFWTTTLIALAGGLLGVLMMIPMRKVFVVDNPDLKFPEGLACAEVLQAGAEPEQSAGGGLRTILTGIAVGGGFKVCQSLLGLIKGSAETAMVRSGRVFYAGAEISPALFAVGFIVTLPIAVEIFVGGALGWLIAIPLLGTDGISSEGAVKMAYEIWSTKVRYLGVGAMVVGGLSSIWTVRHGLLAAIRHILQVISQEPELESDDPRERNLSGRTIALVGLACGILIAGLYYHLLDNHAGLTILTTLIMFVMSFFFAAVASYIVGLVGNSNSPVSGMTITAVLGTGGLMLLFGFGGTAGIVATLGVAGVVCCVACTSGDVCNDLKTGHLVGASPRSQQIMQLIGVVTAAFVMAPIMTILHQGSINSGTGGIGTKDLPAPQAGLFKSLVEGFFREGELPRDMVAWGLALGVLILVMDAILVRKKSPLRLHVMPVAVGIYLPFSLSAPIVLGGLVRHATDRRDPSGSAAQEGVLRTSGIIAGESLIGVALGVVAYLEFSTWNGLEKLASALGWSELGLGQAVSVTALLAVAAWVLLASTRRQSDLSR